MLFEWLVRRPVKELYLRGPVMVGMWGGMPSSDICARLTRVQAEFWMKDVRSIEECDVLIEREIASWAILLTTLLYVFILLKCLSQGVDWLFSAKWTRQTKDQTPSQN